MSEKTAIPQFKDLPGADEVRINLVRRDATIAFIFTPLDEATLRQYRRIYSGPPGSRKGRGKPDAALKYLFEKTFIRTEGVSISSYLEPQGDQPAAYASDKDFWQRHPQAALWTDAAIDLYLGDQRPDEDDTKE